MTLIDWSGGIVRDQPFSPPVNSVYDAVDFLFDRPPKIRKRGGTTAIVVGSQTATGQTLAAITDARHRKIYTFGLGASGGTTGTFRILDLSTGAVTSVASYASVQGFTRAFNHLGHILVGLYPSSGSGNSGVVKVGGATGAKADITSESIGITAGNAVVTLGGLDNTSMEVGMYVYATDNVDTTKKYVGRITSLPAAVATVTVEPVPTLSITASGSNGQVLNTIGNVVTNRTPGGMYGLSFQNRILLFNTAMISADGIVTRTPDTFVYSRLPFNPSPAGGPNYTGLTQFYGTSFSPDNSFQIPEIGEITGAALAAEGHLVIFGPRSCYRGVGELGDTETDDPAGTFGVSRISANVGCISDRSIQYTPQGIVFASQEGVYAFDGNSMQPLMQGRVATTYRAALKAGAKVYGSAYFDGHYYLSMSDHGRLVHLDSQAIPWTRVTNVALFDAVPDPADASKIWGLRWWDQAGAAPSMTGGQHIQLQSITAPASTCRSDADGTAVVPQVTTRAYDGDDPAVIKRWRDLKADYALVNGTSLGIEAAATLDPGNASWSSIGTLSSTTTAEPTPTRLGQAGALRGPGIAYRLTQTGASDVTDIAALAPRAERIGGWRAA